MIAPALTHKIAMRRRWADAGVPQPEFAAVRTLHEGRLAIATLGLPVVLKPADADGRGVFLLRYPDELESHLHAALASSPTQEAIVERHYEGLELWGLAVVHDGAVDVVALSDRQEHLLVHPTSLFGDALEEAERIVRHSVHTLELEEGTFFTRLVRTGDELRMLELSERLPRELRLLQTPADGPVAIRFLSVDGTVRRIGSLAKVQAFPGVVDVRVERDGSGYVVATAATTIEAAARADAAAKLVDIELW